MTLVGIAGIPGSGKTTLAAALAEQFRARIVHVDDYLLDRRGGTPVTLRQVDGTLGVDPNHPDSFDSAGLADDLRQAESLGGWTILDGHFALALRAADALLDHRIWIETPRDVALARKLIRQHFEGGRTLETAGWGYLNNVRPAIDSYLMPSAATAHVILDGSFTTTQLVTEAIRYLGSR